MSKTAQELLRLLLESRAWSESEALAFFHGVVEGQVSDIQLAAAISAINVREVTVAELTGAARALIESATHFPRPDYPFADVVGTGGDGSNTINLSTIAAIVAAACGAKIVKHGNRSISSCSGSFDLLETLGVDFNLHPENCRAQLDQHGICFLFAPNYHPGMKHAADVRKTLKIRTIFNLLGPLVNPSRPPKMLLGVANPRLLRPIAETLSQLGCADAAVVHGSGLDEIAVHGATQVIQIRDGQLVEIQLSPVDFGCPEFSLDDLICHDAAESHRRSIAVLSGKGSDAENAAVAVNVAQVLKLFGNENLTDNYMKAREVLSCGQPMDLVKKIVEANR